MNRFKTYAFWLALSSAVVILVQSLGNLFGFEIESSVIENVIMSICGVLVVLGIVTKKTEPLNVENKTIQDDIENVDTDAIQDEADLNDDATINVGESIANEVEQTTNREEYGTKNLIIRGKDME